MTHLSPLLSKISRISHIYHPNLNIATLYPNFIISRPFNSNSQELFNAASMIDCHASSLEGPDFSVEVGLTFFFFFEQMVGLT